MIVVAKKYIRVATVHQYLLHHIPLKIIQRWRAGYEVKDNKRCASFYIQQARVE